MGLTKPETRITLFYAKCRIKKCDEPYTIMQSSHTEAERSWLHHAFAKHQGKIKKIPPYIVKQMTFKAVKE